MVTLKPDYVQLGGSQGASLASLYVPAALRQDRGVVTVLAGPGEPRSRYARTFRELASVLGRFGVGTLSIELSLADTARESQQKAKAASQVLRDKGLTSCLWLARGLTWVAAAHDDTCPLAVVNPWIALGQSDRPGSFGEQELLQCGFEEAWIGSALPAGIIAAISEEFPVFPPGAIIITKAPKMLASYADLKAREVIQAPSMVRDLLFRRVWEREWLIATVVSLAQRD